MIITRSVIIIIDFVDDVCFCLCLGPVLCDIVWRPFYESYIFHYVHAMWMPTHVDKWKVKYNFHCKVMNIAFILLSFKKV